MTDSQLRDWCNGVLAGDDGFRFATGRDADVRLARAVATRLLELLLPVVSSAGRPFDAWSFLRDVLLRGTRIEQSAEGQGWGYERLSAALDYEARQYADRLKPHLRATT
mgnify:FL=1